MKTAIKHESDAFWVITPKHVSVLRLVVSHVGTIKPWQQLMKMAIKGENDEFLVISLRHVRGRIDLANGHGTPKCGQ